MAPEPITPQCREGGRPQRIRAVRNSQLVCWIRSRRVSAASPPTQYTFADRSHTGIFLEHMGRSPSRPRRASRRTRYVSRIHGCQAPRRVVSVCADTVRSIVISSCRTRTSPSRKVKPRLTMLPTGSGSRSTLMPARRLMERYSCPHRPSTDRKCECPIAAPEPPGTAVSLLPFS